MIVNSAGTSLICEKCLSRSLSASLNCENVDITVCAAFDFRTFRCTQCPDGLVLSSNSDACYSLV